MEFRIGYGEDAHRLSSGLPLWIGSFCIEKSPHGAVAHSDGDALLHALSDALLSAVAQGDIGQHFPDTDERWKNMSSTTILKHCLHLVAQAGYGICNVSGVVTLDVPKLNPSRTEIVDVLSKILDLSENQLGLTFKTSEGLATGHIQARVTVLLGKL